MSQLKSSGAIPARIAATRLDEIRTRLMTCVQKPRVDLARSAMALNGLDALSLPGSRRCLEA